MSRKIFVTKKSATKIQKGNPLIIKDDLVNDITYEQGSVVHVYEGKRFLASALLGEQHKGIAWIIDKREINQIDKEWLLNRLQTAFEKRKKMRIDANAYRLFNAEGDGLGGLTIDYYNQHLQVTFYNRGIYQLQALLVDCLLELIKDVQSIYEKCRFIDSPYVSKKVWAINDIKTDRVIIEENGVKYVTYMDDGLMTGIFLDQRNVRRYIKEHVANQTLLNTFSYTGAFSVSACKGGSQSTTSVDVAKRSIEKTTEQFEINQLKMDANGLYVMDVFDYFKYAIKKKLTFDWVVLDPPSFARTKKRVFSVSKNYGELLADAIKLTAKNGRIVVSTNAANISKKQFEKMIYQTFEKEQVQYRIEQFFSLPEDFVVQPRLEESNYLKVYIVQVL